MGRAERWFGHDSKDPDCVLYRGRRGWRIFDWLHVCYTCKSAVSRILAFDQMHRPR